MKENIILISEVMMIAIKKISYWSRTPVVHAYNPIYSGGRDPEDHSLKPARANNSWEPISKKKKNPLQ
jgi:hypothetical protein